MDETPKEDSIMTRLDTVLSSRTLNNLLNCLASPAELTTFYMAFPELRHIYAPLKDSLVSCMARLQRGEKWQVALRSDHSNRYYDFLLYLHWISHVVPALHKSRFRPVNMHTTLVVQPTILGCSLFAVKFIPGHAPYPFHNGLIASDSEGKLKMYAMTEARMELLAVAWTGPFHHVVASEEGNQFLLINSRNRLTVLSLHRMTMKVMRTDLGFDWTRTVGSVFLDRDTFISCDHTFIFMKYVVDMDTGEVEKSVYLDGHELSRYSQTNMLGLNCGYHHWRFQFYFSRMRYGVSAGKALGRTDIMIFVQVCGDLEDTGHSHHLTLMEMSEQKTVYRCCIADSLIISWTVDTMEGDHMWLMCFSSAPADVFFEREVLMTRNQASTCPLRTKMQTKFLHIYRIDLSSLSDSTRLEPWHCFDMSIDLGRKYGDERALDKRVIDIMKNPSDLIFKANQHFLVFNLNPFWLHFLPKHNGRDSNAFYVYNYQETNSLDVSWCSFFLAAITEKNDFDGRGGNDCVLYQCCPALTPARDMAECGMDATILPDTFIDDRESIEIVLTESRWK